MKRMNDNCAEMESKLADMLFDPEAAPAKVQSHVANCERCQAELAELRTTMSLLDAWKAPEPNPYFFTQLNAKIREEREALPSGWFARLRASFAYGPRAHVRPLAAVALTTVLLVGGGAYLGVTNWNRPPQPTAQAAVVHNLQTLDNNAQLLDQLESISSNDNGN
jgi:anti-sigma factor RsiW